MRALSLLLALGSASCAAAAPQTLGSPSPRALARPLAPASPGVAPPAEPRHLRPEPCAGSLRPGDALATRTSGALGPELPAARSPLRRGRGYRWLVPPPGFLPVRADPRSDPTPDLLATYRTERADGSIVTVEVFDHPVASPPGPDLFRWLVTSFDANGSDVDDEVETESLFGWFDRAAEMRDGQGRRVVEWAYVQKGCERGELYERFVEDDGHVWHVRLDVSPTANEADLGLWMALLFDAPLEGPAPADRAGLAGRRSRR